jgi:predicted aminopeptidase
MRLLSSRLDGRTRAGRRASPVRESLARRAATRHELDQIRAPIAELSERREHLHSTAAGILAPWVAWFDATMAYHRAGFIRSLTRWFPASVLTIEGLGNLSMPRYEPTYAWAARNNCQ